MSVEHRIDVLVNNAGLLAKASVVEAGVEHFRQVMETNFFGCLELIAAVTPQMIQRQTGGHHAVKAIACCRCAQLIVHRENPLCRPAAQAQAGMQAHGQLSTR